MRTFKRLFPVFLVAVLLAGVALARPAGVISSTNSQLVAVAKSQFKPGYDNPRLYFGTIVRDTADDQGFAPGRQLPPEASPWTSFFSWSWLSLLISR